MTTGVPITDAVQSVLAQTKQAFGGVTTAFVPLSLIPGTSPLAQQRAANIAAFLAGPKIVAPAWAATTAYAVGACVQIANGQHIICSAAGTSGGTQPVFSSTVLDGRPLTDGTVTWYGLPWQKSTSDVNAPTITTGASPAALGLTAKPFYTNLAGTVKVFGALPVNYAGSYIGRYTFATAPIIYGNGNAQNDATTYGGQSSSWAWVMNDCVYEFYQTDSIVGLYFGNTTSNVVIEIDGQPLQGNPLPTSGSNGYTMKIDFNGVVRRRRVRIFDKHDTNFQGAAVTTLGFIEPGDSANDNLLVFGDSIPITMFPNPADFTMFLSSYTQRLLGMTGAINCSVSGTGYSPTSVVYSNPYVFNSLGILQNSANQAVLGQLNPTHILFMLGYNDAANNSGNIPQIVAGALQAWQAARALFPTIKITVLDCMSEATGPNANVIAVAAAITAQFAAWGDTNSRLIQAVGAGGNAAWINGTGNTSIAIAAGNASNLIGNDGIHPAPLGHYYFAQRCAADIIAAWNGNY